MLISTSCLNQCEITEGQQQLERQTYDEQPETYLYARWVTSRKKDDKRKNEDVEEHVQKLV